MTRTINKLSRLGYRAMIIAGFTLYGNLSHADLSGTWQLDGKQSLTLALADDQTRLDVGNQHTMLISPTQAFFITQQGGRRLAMDLDQMAGMLSLFGGAIQQQVQQAAGGEVSDTVRLHDTGRQETVAGFAGRVFLIKRPGQADQELVLSKDPALIKLQQAYHQLGERLTQLVRNPGLSQTFALVNQQASELGYQGVLRYQDRFVLQSVSRQALPDSHFQLPPGTTRMTLPGFGGTR